MYFPYLRGRQFELIALRELVENSILSDKIIPIVEPVKLSTTLIKTLEVFLGAHKKIALIRNPQVGEFVSELKKSKNALLTEKLYELVKYDDIIDVYFLNLKSKKTIAERIGHISETITICDAQDNISVFEEIFTSEKPKYNLIPDESVFRRRIRNNRVMLDDKFKKQIRNTDYAETDDEPFSTDHLYYNEDGYVGFSDYSVIGKEYSETGFAPYAVAIHIVYFEHSLLRTNSWEDFVTSLKKQNRFHTNYINLEILERFCSYIRKPYKKGTILFRGRISSSVGLCADEMGAPPYEKASAGRANAPGISCLYLASDVDTTIHEVRAGAFDFISVGKFELQDDIIVVDLKSIDKISPFLVDLDYLEHAINKEHLNKINTEMGKALRRNDSTLDYVPTQYISDFIKSIEYDGQAEYAGIEYNSTMNAGGFNLAIFYADLFKCVDVETYRIKDLLYQKENIKD